MSVADRVFGNSIRGRMWLGFGTLVALLLVAGVVAKRAFDGMSETIATSLGDVQAEAQLTGSLSADVAETMEAGSRYIDAPDSATDAAFRQYGWAAHSVQRQMNDRPGQTATEVMTIAAIDRSLSTMEVNYALAHRLVGGDHVVLLVRVHRQVVQLLVPVAGALDVVPPAVPNRGEVRLV